jgi:hypothetical protein
MIVRMFPVVAFAVIFTLVGRAEQYDYRVLATNKTSTMEKEMNEAAGVGYVFSGVMGGETGFAGSEVVVIMAKAPSASSTARKYKLLATSKTRTMQEEIQQAGDEGFEYRGQTVFKSTFGGHEVSVILEKNEGLPTKRYEYRLLATSKTSTMQKELQAAGDEGFEFLGVTVGKTSFGGSEIVSFLRKVVE